MNTSFDRLTEMAWHALSNFINPLDCSIKAPHAVFPLNKTADLELIFNHETRSDGSRCKPYYLSKLRLKLHLAGVETYYYRSRYNAVAKIGYGSCDQARNKLDFADTLGITGRCQPFPQVGVMLLGLDIDAHHGERHVAQVKDLMLEQYFPRAYWEPSTSGKGIHLYIKLTYSPTHAGDLHKTLRYLHGVMADLGAILDKCRVQSGLDAPIDKIRGLPSLIGFNAQSGRIVVSNRSICIKIPRFKNGEPDVLRFWHAPWFRFENIEDRIKKQKLIDLVSLPDDPGTATPMKLVKALTSEPESYISPNEDLRGDDDDEGGEGTCNSNSVCPARGYAGILKELRAEPDAYRRSLRFALAYTRHLRRVPDLNELLQEYEKQKLNTGSDLDGNRGERLKFIRNHLVKTFKPDRLGFGYGGFTQELQNQLTNEIKDLLVPSVKLQYVKVKTRPIKVEELAVVYFALLRSQGQSPATSFSVLQVKEAFRQVNGKGVSSHKASALLRILEQLGLIQRVGGYVPGLRGWVWAVKKPSNIDLAA